MSTLAFVVYALAVYRVTLLVSKDEITERPRDWLLDALNNRAHRVMSRGERTWRCKCGTELVAALSLQGGDIDLGLHESFNSHRAWLRQQGFLYRLLDCPWCTSMYVAPVAFACSWWWWTGWAWWMVAGSAAASAVTGVLAEKASP